MPAPETEVTDQYILIDRRPVPCPDLAEWSAWFRTANRQVARTKVGDLELRTVFSGVDHRRFGVGESDDGPPLVFDTMVFGAAGHPIARCSTWEEAEEMHRRAVRLALPQVATAADVTAPPVPPAIQPAPDPRA